MQLSSPETQKFRYDRYDKKMWFISGLSDGSIRSVAATWVYAVFLCQLSQFEPVWTVACDVAIERGDDAMVGVGGFGGFPELGLR